MLVHMLFHPIIRYTLLTTVWHIVKRAHTCTCVFVFIYLKKSINAPNGSSPVLDG